MSDNNIDRETLLRIANLVRPALASQPYIPALTHICFAAGRATAFNDVVAISVKYDLDIERCIPGEFLIKTLSSFSGDKLLVQEGKDGALVVASGRSKVKVPTLDTKAFPLSLPDGGESIELDEDILTGIKRCLLSVGTDPTHPAHMGVTLDVSSKGRAVLYSTDNHTLSRYQTKVEVELPGNAPIIMPTFFCEQLVKLAATFDKAVTLHLHAGALLARIGKEVTIFSKTLVDLEPMDFARVITKQVDLDNLTAVLDAVPPGFDAALDRALLVLSDKQDKKTVMRVEDDKLHMRSESTLGDSEDRFPLGSRDITRSIDPALVARGVKHCTGMHFGDNSLVMADTDHKFLHIVAYVNDNK